MDNVIFSLKNGLFRCEVVLESTKPKSMGFNQNQQLEDVDRCVICPFELSEVLYYRPFLGLNDEEVTPYTYILFKNGCAHIANVPFKEFDKAYLRWKKNPKVNISKI